MTTAIRPIEYYVERIKKQLLRRFPELTFETIRLADNDVYLYFDNYGPETEWADVARLATTIAVNALVEADYAISVFPARNGPAYSAIANRLSFLGRYAIIAIPQGSSRRLEAWQTSSALSAARQWLS